MFILGSEFIRLELKHCSEDKYGDYSTLEGAQSACTVDSNCQGVYDDDCDGLGSHYLCPINAQLIVPEPRESCVYTKGEK